MPVAVNPSDSLRSSLAYKVQRRRDAQDDLDPIHWILPWGTAEPDRLPVKGIHEAEVPGEIGLFPSRHVILATPQCLRIADHSSLPRRQVHESDTITIHAPPDETRSKGGQGRGEESR